MSKGYNSRRDFLMSATAAGSALLLSACGGRQSENGSKHSAPGGEEQKSSGIKESDLEVTAVEDLMREHGVLRRALLVYGEAASQLHRSPGSVSPAALQKTAKLFRDFGEDYHEKKLEEAFIFPSIKRTGGPAAAYLDILVDQHDRGREITGYILSVTQGAKLGADAGALAEALDGFVRMYQHHAAREDTVVFPAWKETVSEQEYKELSERFEEIERQQFGGDGFEDAVKQIGEIERSLGLADIAQFTAPPPAK